MRIAMRLRVLAVLALALVGAQGGHLLAYQLRFGAAAQQIQSTGLHAYFPPAVKTALGASALVVLGSLLVIGIARVVAYGHRVRAAGGPAFLPLLAVLFTLQLAWFVGQEVTEALVAGVQPDSAAHLLLWGMTGQLPVAVAGAVVLHWLGRRVEAAVSALGSVIPAAAPALVASPVAIRFSDSGERALATFHSARSPFVRRGPPSSSAFRPF